MPEPKWSGRNPTPDTGGATTLTDLTDVTGTAGPGMAPVGDANGNFPLTPTVTQEDLNAILASVAAVNWHNIGDPGEPQFQNGFRSTNDPPWAPPRYRLTLNNVVHLEGHITNDDQTTGNTHQLPMFQLPPETAPGASLRFTGIARDDSLGRIIVWEDGTVMWDGYLTGPGDTWIPYLSLSDVSFSVGA